MVVNRYKLLQGKIHLSPINSSTGMPTEKFRFVGNVPTGGFTVSPEAEKISHEESYTGQNLTDMVIERRKKQMGVVRLENIDKDNLILALYGTATAKSGATISAEAHTAYPGYSFFLNRINLTSFTSLTNTDASVTYDVNDDYTVNLKTGEVIVVAGGAITDGLAVKANYVAGTSEIVTSFSATNQEQWLRFSGVNNAESDNPFVFEGFKVRFQPATSMELINDQVTSLELNFELLYQSLLDGVADYDGYSRFIQKVAA